MGMGTYVFMFFFYMFYIYTLSQKYTAWSFQIVRAAVFIGCMPASKRKFYGHGCCARCECDFFYMCCPLKTRGAAKTKYDCTAVHMKNCGAYIYF